MIVYHGSEQMIEQPVFGGGKATNDYGRGFYTTEHEALAKEWACARGNDGYSNRYQLDLNGLKVLNLNSGEYNILNWLAVLTRHRSYWQNSSISEEAKRYLQDHFYVNTDRYDIIIGYRADDSYFTFAQDFVANTISLDTLRMAMHLGELGEQIVLKSRKAFQCIQFLGSEPALAETYFDEKTNRDLEARRAYREARTHTRTTDGIYMIDIIREGMTDGDPRLQ